MHSNNLPDPLPRIKQEDICTPCVQGKLVSKRTRKRRKSHPTDGPLRTVIIDILGPFKESIYHNNTRAITLIDQWSGFALFGFLRSKESVAVTEKLLHMLDVLYVLSTRKVHTIRSDFGGEFTSAYYRKTLTNLGYNLEYGAPYTPSNQGRVERLHRYILGLARSTRLHAGLPEAFWEECLRNAVNVYNVMGTRTNGCPHFYLTGRRPSYKHFRVLGSKCLYRIPTNIPKFSDRTRRGILIAQPTDSAPDVLRIYNPDTKRIIRTRSAVVFESEFYKFEGDEITNESTTRKKEQVPLYSDSDSDGDSSSDDDNNNTNIRTEANNEQRTNSPLRSIGAQEQIQYLQEHEARQRERGRPISRELAGLRINDNRSWTRLSTRSTALIATENENASVTSDSDPKSYKEITQRHDKDAWNQAIISEITGLFKLKAFHLIKCKPEDRTVHNPKWVFNKKTDQHGNLERYKARLTIAAWNALQGLDYFESYAPVVARDTIRMCFALAALRKYHLRQFDTPLAYLNGSLDTPAYMKIPPGLHLVKHLLDKDSLALFESGDPNVICEVTKPLYGLPQSGKCWYDELSSKLAEIGFKPSTGDPALFIKRTDHGVVIILAYVDDLCAMASRVSDLDELEATMYKHWATKSFSTPKWYLKMEVNCTPGRISMNQTQYITKIIEQFGMAQASPSPVPCIQTDFVPTDQDTPYTGDDYKSLLGSLLYISNGTRPDISYAVCLCARYASAPLTRHYRALRRILKYLLGTKHLGLVYSATDFSLNTYADSSYADDANDKKSTSGRTILIDGGPISWSSEKQKCVATSTAEAEYMSLGAAAKDVVWTRNLLNEIDELPPGPSLIYQDNTASISMATNVKVSSKSKHIQVRHHFVRDLINDKIIYLEHMPTEHMIADILTKPLGRVAFERLRDRLVKPANQ